MVGTEDAVGKQKLRVNSLLLQPLVSNGSARERDLHNNPKFCFFIIFFFKALTTQERAANEACSVLMKSGPSIHR